MQDLTNPRPSVQDADSENVQGRKTEGAFYLWTAAELDEVLGGDAELVRAFYYVKPQGNADLSPMRCAPELVLERLVRAGQGVRGHQAAVASRVRCVSHGLGSGFCRHGHAVWSAARPTSLLQPAAQHMLAGPCTHSACLCWILSCLRSGLPQACELGSSVTGRSRCCQPMDSAQALSPESWSACSDPHQEFGGLNCLIARGDLAQAARQAGVDREAAARKLAAAREKLHGVRAKRPRPHLDDKVSPYVDAIAVVSLWAVPGPPPEQASSRRSLASISHMVHTSCTAEDHPWPSMQVAAGWTLLVN